MTTEEMKSKEFRKIVDHIRRMGTMANAASQWDYIEWLQHISDISSDMMKIAEAEKYRRTKFADMY